MALRTDAELLARATTGNPRSQLAGELLELRAVIAKAEGGQPSEEAKTWARQ
mgnify:FL=1